MTTYLITWQESDGNDCTVYDSIVTAPTESDALSLLSDAIEKQLTADDVEFEGDGNELGYYFGCDCDEENAEFCDGHGGISLRTVETYTSESEAEQNRSRFHTLYTI